MEKVDGITGGMEEGLSNSFTFKVPNLSQDDKKKAYFIALTGGPKGGKTKTLSPLIRALRAEGFITIAYGETATEFINNKYHPNAPTSKGKVSIYDFQEGITTSQVSKEVMSRRRANQYLQTSDRVAVIYDRAVPDGRAYIDEENFNKILSSVGNWTLEDFLSTYSIVVHFVSTAKDKLEVFLKDQKDQKRIEDDINETLRLEDETREIYPDGPNKIVLGNDCTFKEKQDRAINGVISYIKRDTKTIRINSLDKNLLKQMKKKNTTSANGQKRAILYGAGHTYILGRYQDGSKVVTLEMMDGAPVPEWVLDFEEPVIEDPMRLVITSGINQTL